MFRSLIRKWTARSHSSRKPARRTARLRVESFEERCLLSSFGWVGGDGDFNDPANWRDQANNPGVPGVSDDAYAAGGSLTITSAVSNTVNSFHCNSRLRISGGTFTVNDQAVNSAISGLVLDNGGTLEVAGGSLSIFGGATIAGHLDVASQAALAFSLGPVSLNAGTTWTGPGLYDMAGANVTLNTPLTTPANFQDEAGTLSGPATLTVGTVFNWTNTAHLGVATLSVPSGTALNISGNSFVTLDGGTVANQGTINWTSGSISVYGTLDNQSGGVWNLSADNQSITGSGMVSNEGTMTKTSVTGSGATYIGSHVPFNDTGLLDVESGSVQIGTDGGVTSGTLHAASGASVAFVQGVGDQTNYTLASTAQLTGPGQFEFTPSFSSSLTVNGNLSVQNFQLAAGALAGPGSLTVANGLVWSGGDLAVTATTISPTATLNIQGGNNHRVNGATLINAGTATWTDTGALQVANAGVLKNSGTFNVQNDQLLSPVGNGGGTVLNTGTWNKTSTTVTGTTAIGTVFNNSGTVNVNSGILSLGGGGTELAGKSFITAAGAELLFAGDTYTLNSGALLAGAGTEAIGGTGILSIAGNVTIPHLEVDSGTLAGAGSLTVSNSLLFNGGAINDQNGHVIVPHGATLTIQGNGTKTFYNGTINVAGKVQWMDSGDIQTNNLSTFNVQAGATFSILNDQHLAGGGTFNNGGLLTKAGGTATTVLGMVLNNSGQVQVHAGTLNLSGGVSQVSGNTLTGGSWAVFGKPSATSTLMMSSVSSLTTIGADAVVSLTGPKAVFSNLSALAVNQGSFSLLGGQGFTTAGDFSNQGTLTLSPTTVFTVKGSFTNTASATLNVQIGGTSASPKMSRIVTSPTGSVTLDGTLNLSSTVLPAVGTTLTLIRNQANTAVSGIFAGLPEGSTITVNGATYQISYVGGAGGHDVVLSRIS